MKRKIVMLGVMLVLLSPSLSAQVCNSASLAASVACAKSRRTTIDLLDLQTAGVVSTMHRAFPAVATYPYVAIGFQPLTLAPTPYVGAAIMSSWYGGWYGWRVAY